MTRPVTKTVRVLGACAVMVIGLIAAPGWPGGVLAGSAQTTETATAAPAAPADQPGPAAAPPAPIETAPQMHNADGVGASTLPHNLSPWNMFLAADIVVKGVMIGLALASLVTWTVWLTKSVELMVSRRRLARAATLLEGALSLDDARHRLDRQRGPATGLIAAATHELALSADVHDKSAIRDRVQSRLDDGVAAAGRQINTGTGLLATIGSTAPFVGLFGTVWGIMNSFISISESQTTNLAIVAPGIAEALLATAIGLVAAIPAVIIYNQFARAISAYKASLAEVSSEIQRFVSRDLDRTHRAVRAHAAE